MILSTSSNKTNNPIHPSPKQTRLKGHLAVRNGPLA